MYNMALFNMYTMTLFNMYNMALEFHIQEITSVQYRN